MPDVTGVSGGLRGPADLGRLSPHPCPPSSSVPEVTRTLDLQKILVAADAVARTGFGWSGLAKNQVPALVAEVERLTAELDRYARDYELLQAAWDGACDQIAAARQESDRIRAALHAAPHTRMCRTRNDHPITRPACDCWKSRAQDPQEAPNA